MDPVVLWAVSKADSPVQSPARPTACPPTPGLHQALAAGKTATSKRVYYDFADMLRTNPSGNVPYTPVLPLLYGMRQSLQVRVEGTGWWREAPSEVEFPGRSLAAVWLHFSLPCPLPPPLLLLLQLLADEGMPNVVARHARLAEGCRRAVEGWGLQTLCRNPRWKSDSLTVVEVPQGVDSQKVVDNAYAK